MEAKTIKDLIKTTEGAIVLGGLTLTVLSPAFPPEIWAIGTGVAYVLVNVDKLWNKVKEVFGKIKGVFSKKK